MPTVTAAPLRARVSYFWKATSVGTSRICVDPSPRRPEPFRPQQYVRRVPVVVQAWFWPTVILANVSPPLTALGESDPAPADPSCAKKLSPQHQAEPPLS